ncbi:MAG: shikimate dehydrogenase [Propionibacteriaceae bacterium]|nr:shikimate dehydrogenase [Propionibacteriaceae bacterium]
MPTYRAAVLGSPVAHSLSPVIHNAGYLAVGLSDWEYGRLEIGTAELGSLVSRLDESWRGLSLTRPLKFEALQVADRLTRLAELSGVANTLVRLEDGSWQADNTDIGGFLDALGGVVKAKHKSAAVLGAGATARSAVLALEELGVLEVNVYVRDLEKAYALADWATGKLKVQVTAGYLNDWPLGDEPIVVSTLPAGVGLEFPIFTDARVVVMDSVYAGWPTPFAQGASASGAQVVGGFDLLVNQAVRQFEQFTNVEAPKEIMRKAGWAALHPDSFEA